MKFKPLKTMGETENLVMRKLTRSYSVQPVTAYIKILADSESWWDPDLF
jgi:hypothetical protein